MESPDSGNVDEDLSGWRRSLKEQPNIIVMSSIFPNCLEVTKGIYIFHQAKALSQYCNVKVVAPVPYFPKWIKSDAYSLYSDIPRRETIQGLDVLHPRVIVIPKVGRALYGFLYAFSLLKVFRNLKERFSPDLLLCYWIYPDGFACVILSKLFGLPSILGGRGCDVNDAESSYAKLKMVTWALDKTDRIFSVSHAMKLKMVELGVLKKKIQVIPNGLDDGFQSQLAHFETPRPGKDDTPRTILFLGRLSPEKGVEYLIRAADILNQKNIQFNIQVVGDGPDKPVTRQLVDELGLSRVVQFRDAIPHDKIPELLSKVDILCLPSIREGWPNVVMEALACGKPVVASDVGGIPEIVTGPEYGYLVPSKDPLKLADALDAALAREWDHRKISYFVRSRTWDRVASEIYDQIKMVLEQ